MKITFVIQDLFGCGAQYVTALMVRGFIAKGYDVDLIVSPIHKEMRESGCSDAFDVPRKTNWIVMPFRKARQNIPFLRRYMRKTDSRAIIAMSSTYSTAIALAGIGLRKKPRVVHVEHNGNVGVTWDGAPKKRPSLFSLCGVRNFILGRLWDSLLAVSPGQAKAMDSIYFLPSGTTKVVYNPVVDEVFLERLKGSPSHPWLVDNNIPTFVAASSHTGCKRIQLIMEAIKIANETRPVRLVQFGRGKLTDEYVTYIKANHLEDRICLAGFTDRLPAELKGATAFICASSVESFSVVIVEALASGCPVISTDCPYGPRGILRDGRFGTLVKNGDVNGLVAAILQHCEESRQLASEESWRAYEVMNIVGLYENAIGLMPRYVYCTSPKIKEYSINANANQKVEMTLKNLHGVLCVKAKELNLVPEELRDKCITNYESSDVVLCAPSNEVALLKELVNTYISPLKRIVFCWDPLGVTRRDSRSLICKIRCFLMDFLLYWLSKRILGIVLNLHPGFIDENRILNRIRRKIVTFPNGTCIERNVDLTKDVRHVRRRIAVNNAFNARKGCWEIARLLVRARELIPDLSVAWVGHGGEVSAVVRYLLERGFSQDSIHIPGKCDNEEALCLMASADIALNAYPDIPSLRWNYVLKAPEFLSLGLPIISVALPGVMEYVREGQTGVLFKSGDWEAALEKVVSLLKEPGTIDSMRAACVKLSMLYDWRDINCRIAEHIRMLSEG